MTAFWVAIPVGLLIVLFAVGIPYWLSHRNLHPQKDRSEAHAYLETTGKTAEDAVSGRPGRRWRKRGAARKRSQASSSGRSPQAGRPTGSGTA